MELVDDRLICRPEVWEIEDWSASLSLSPRDIPRVRPFDHMLPSLYPSVSLSDHDEPSLWEVDNPSDTPREMLSLVWCCVVLDSVRLSDCACDVDSFSCLLTVTVVLGITTYPSGRTYSCLDPRSSLSIIKLS